MTTIKLQFITPKIKNNNKEKIPIIIDPKGYDFKKYTGGSYLTPNLNELECIIGKVNDESFLISKSLQLIKDYKLKGLIVTRSERVTLIEESGLNITFPAMAKKLLTSLVREILSFQLSVMHLLKVISHMKL